MNLNSTGVCERNLQNIFMHSSYHLFFNEGVSQPKVNSVVYVK